MQLSKGPKCIAIDVTAITPGGDNGGSKVMTIELINGLSTLAHSCKFILLTHEISHKELAFLDRSNVHRVCIEKFTHVARMGFIKKKIKSSIFLKNVYYKYLKRFIRSKTTIKVSLLKQLEVDLLFCPFASFKPIIFDADNIPMVSIIYDLQHITYPQFFTEDEIKSRNQRLDDISKRATSVVCISNYTLNSVLKNTKIRADDLFTVHIRMANRLKLSVSSDIKNRVLKAFDLNESEFMLYPANFWPHKNHILLFIAYRMYRQCNPQSTLKLVCTGATGERLGYLKDVVFKMGISKCVIFSGYLQDKEFLAILQSCRAVIYPSLYEGFGMPVIEAMSYGKPVFCSNTTSLPEVAGNAAYLFDPRKPKEIVEAIKIIDSDSERLDELSKCGLRRSYDFACAKDMAREYWNIFVDTMYRHKAIYGIYDDSWTSNCVSIHFGAYELKRSLNMEFTLPKYVPYGIITLNLLVNGLNMQKFYLESGAFVKIFQNLSCDSAVVEIHIDQVFQPSNYGLNDDSRYLGCIMTKCEVISSISEVNLLKECGNVV